MTASLLYHCWLHHRTRMFQRVLPCAVLCSSSSPSIGISLSANIINKGISSSNRNPFWKLETKTTPVIHTTDISSSKTDGKVLLDRYIFVKTLNNFYEDVPNGIILDTAYADSRPHHEFDAHVPVVVGLHDTPGSHKDLVPVLSTFAKMGCRVIAPTFPGHGDTQGLLSGFDDVFTQSTIEKATFVHDFLRNLGIPRVDLLVGVGASCYPTMYLCTGPESQEMYKSMALISPWPLTRPRFEPSPEVMRRINALWDRPFFRPPLRVLLSGYQCGPAQGTREKITMTYLLNNLDLGEAGGLALASGSMNLPRLIVFGEMDLAVEKDLYYEFLDKMDIPQSNVSVFSGKLDALRLPGALVFPDGGNDLHLRNPGIISALLLNLIELFHPCMRL